MLISDDAQVIQREVELPGGRGRQVAGLRVTGIASFLAAKAEALTTANIAATITDSSLFISFSFSVRNAGKRDGPQIPGTI